jgi:hypothetical protein
MTVLMILLLLGAALIARSQSQLIASAGSTDAAAAEAGAEQGVAEAIARLDAGDRGDFSGAGVIAGGTYSFEVTEVTSTSYVVRAEGEVDGMTRAVEVAVGGQEAAELPYTLFVDGSASIVDNPLAITGRVGTNGPIDVVGTPPGDTVDLYGPAATCALCPDTTSFADPLTVPGPEVPIGPRQTCPRSGNFKGVIDGRDGTPFVCDTAAVARSQVSFKNNLTVVNGPLIIYVRTGLDVDFKNASVNVGNDAEDFQLLAEGTSDWVDGTNSQISGLLYAPGRDATLDGLDLVGSLTIGDLSIPSGSGAAMAPPANLGGGGVSGWTVESWERVPAG